MNRFSPLAHVAILLLYCLATNRAVATSNDPDLLAKAAIADASKRHSPVLLYFYNEGCSGCKLMDSTTLTDTKVVAWVSQHCPMTRIQPITSDLSLCPVAESLSVFGFPTFLLIGSDGKEIDRHLGYLDPKQFISTFEEFLAGKNTLTALVSEATHKPRIELYAQIAHKYGMRGDLINVGSYVSKVLALDPAGENQVICYPLYEYSSLLAGQEQYDSAIAVIHGIQKSCSQSNFAKIAEHDLIYYYWSKGDNTEAAALLREYVRKYPTEKNKETDALLFELTGDIEY